MERWPLDQLSAKATVASNLPEAGFLSRQQRLQRWSELLAREPDRLLNTCPQTEYMDAQVRASMRCADSALTVAFEDPRSEEHTSELQSLMRIPYAVFCSITKMLSTTSTHISYNHT